VPDTVCFNQFCVGAGALRISLAFEADTDLDLHVITPLAQHIFYGQRLADGGELDVDQCVTSCGVGAHAENVVFADSAPTGTYQVYVVNYAGRSAASYTIQVAGLVSTNFSGTLPATAGAESEVFQFTR
jgi:uncharacterized protein YfaP (DUF2135 family)